MELTDLYQPKKLVGHSLGSAIVNQILFEKNKTDNIRYIGRGYAAPIMRNSIGMFTYRHYLDPISITNREATMTMPEGFNPHAY